jgi:hypothetical protein
MAQFFTDFDEYSAGEIGSVSGGDFVVQATPGGDWTNTLVDAGGGDLELVIQRTVTAQGLTVIDYPAMDTSGDIEVYARFKVNTTADQNAPVGPALIASDNRCYAWRPTAAATATTWRLSLFGTAGTVDTSIGSNATFTEPTAGTYYKAKVRREGTTISGKIWLDGDPEPGSAMCSGTNSTLTNVSPGVVTLDSSDEPYTFSAFSVGDDSGGTLEDAPLSAPSGGTNFVVDYAQGVGEGSEVTLISTSSIVMPVTFGSGVGEGQQIPFQYSAIYEFGQGVGEGSEVVLTNFTGGVTDAEGVGEGSVVGMNLLMPVVYAQGVGQGSNVGLVAIVVLASSAGRKRSARRSTFVSRSFSRG